MQYSGRQRYGGVLLKVVQLAKLAGLETVEQFETRSTFNESETYISSRARPSERQAWVREGGTGRSDLFRRSVDHLLVPYAKAVAGEGYRFSPDLFAERFGLSDSQRDYIRAALRPANGKKHEVQSASRDIRTGTIDRAELMPLCRAATGVELPERGIAFLIEEDVRRGWQELQLTVWQGTKSPVDEGKLS